MQSQHLVENGLHVGDVQTCTSKPTPDVTSLAATPSAGYAEPFNRKLVTDADFDSEFDEDVDEDLTDDECQFSFENFVHKKSSPRKDAATESLLTFIEMVNSDIQKYFGRNKGNDDSCDVYQDKWTSGKSGRELYYADLMKIAQGLDTDEPKSPPKSDTLLRDKKNGITKQTEVYSGKLDLSAGLGPLEGLFESGVKPGGGAKKTVKHNQIQGKRSKVIKTEDNSKRAKILPMSDRALPQSFWKEPKNSRLVQVKLDKSDHTLPTSNNNNNSTTVDNTNKCFRRTHGQTHNVDALGHHTSIPPDFGDLLDCWGDVAHIATSCPPGGPQTNHIHTRGHATSTTATT